MDQSYVPVLVSYSLSINFFRLANKYTIPLIPLLSITVHYYCRLLFSFSSSIIMFTTGIVPIVFYLHTYINFQISRTVRYRTFTVHFYFVTKKVVENVGVW